MRNHPGGREWPRRSLAMARERVVVESNSIRCSIRFESVVVRGSEHH